MNGQPNIVLDNPLKYEIPPVEQPLHLLLQDKVDRPNLLLMQLQAKFSIIEGYHNILLAEFNETYFDP